MTYRILARYYYEGFGDKPEDGYLCLWSDINRYREFNSHETALKWLETNCGEMELCKGKATYTHKDKKSYPYEQGEYECPHYTIVHFKDKGEN